LNYSSQHAIEHILHAHSRAISDINWSLHDPNMLATCSVDTYVHLWDMRIIGQDAHSGEEGIAIGDRSIRPESSFCAWTGNVVFWEERTGLFEFTILFLIQLEQHRSNLIERTNIS
jgi:WD40 repeat protein